MRHLLVTNDFPPKTGGIQSYLWELWRRLPSTDFAVMTTPHPEAAAWDQQQPYAVKRVDEWWMLPTRSLARRINAYAAEINAQFVVLDPVLPLGLLGKHLHLPYVVIAHGAEYTIPARLPFVRGLIGRVTAGAVGVIGAGAFVTESVERVLAHKNAQIPTVSIVPGVDTQRFRPLSTAERMQARSNWGITYDTPVVLGVSRLVPRKGFDRLVRASRTLKKDLPNVQVLIAGSGREQKRLQSLAKGLPVRFLGRVSDEDLPALYGMADVFVMPCHDRWAGFEQEGFGIVFAEAAAAGVPSVAGTSGGSGEAVIHEKTGLLVPGRAAAEDVAAATYRILTQSDRADSWGVEARLWAEQHFSYAKLSADLQAFLEEISLRVSLNS